RLSQALATSAIRPSWAARRLSSVARNCCSAAWLRLRTRPNRSSSNAARPTPAVYRSCTGASPPVRSRVALAPTEGRRSARWIRYWARARSTLRIAMRRSRLLSSAWPTSSSSRGSAKKSRQPMSAASSPSAVAWGGRASAPAEVTGGRGHSAGIAASAWGTRGSSIAQPETKTLVASASAVISCLFTVFHLPFDQRLFPQLGVEDAFDHQEEQRDEEHAQEGAHDHAADHAGTDRALRAGAGPGGEREWQHAQAEGQRGHDDRAQAVADGLHDAADQAHAGHQVGLGELDDQDRVLAGQSHRGEHGDLEVHVALVAAEAGEQHRAKDAERGHQQHRGRDGPALVERRQA